MASITLRFFNDASAAVAEGAADQVAEQLVNTATETVAEAVAEKTIGSVIGATASRVTGAAAANPLLAAGIAVGAGAAIYGTYRLVKWLRK